ncbi:MAG: hypothetical protein EXX96DRAFT_550735, partial [Benjaminiella poitrasii]
MQIHKKPNSLVAEELIEPTTTTTDTENATAAPASTSAHNKRTKQTYYYLEGRSVADEPVLEDIKWVVDSKDVSKELLNFREMCKKEGAKGEKLQSSIEE